MSDTTPNRGAIVTKIDIVAANVSEAWLDMLRALQAADGHKAFHTVVRITDAASEEPEVREAADRLLADLDLYSIDTVANTIFPAQIAATSADHDEFVARYRRMYPALKARLRDNGHGTYFGRLVAYPAGETPLDQIAVLVNRLARERASGQPKSARYEVAVAHPSDLVDDADLLPEITMGTESDSDTAGDNDPLPSFAAPIYIPGMDNSPMGFPCLSHVSFQLGRDDQLHGLAQYRSQYLVQRGYGNYLGLGRLLTYIAGQAGIAPGVLTVVAGYAQVETAQLRVRRLVSDTYTLF
jgi:hypothetical protein